MPTTMYDIMHPGASKDRESEFPYAPDGWSMKYAVDQATAEGLSLNDDHWEAIRVLHGCYTDEPTPRIRLLHDALEARFKSKGGMRYLYEMFPNGPAAQGCRLAGLHPPSGSTDGSSGSVQ